MPIQDDDIRWLLALAESENLAEIEVRTGDGQVLVRRRDVVATAVASAQAADGALPEAAAIEATLPENVVPLVAPMSGVFYRAASPDSPPYVEVGQPVEPGETVGLIEAMKLFNDVTVEVSGTVLQVLAQNEEQVEAGAPLMYIET
jgi:acetyl-CoA carboxylase biotin carboxyl carrier protein